MTDKERVGTAGMFFLMSELLIRGYPTSMALGSDSNILYMPGNSTDSIRQIIVKTGSSRESGDNHTCQFTIQERLLNDYRPMTAFSLIIRHVVYWHCFNISHIGLRGLIDEGVGTYNEGKNNYTFTFISHNHFQNTICSKRLMDDYHSNFEVLALRTA
jgi:hypothetical protein